MSDHRFGEVRLVPMVEFLDPKGNVARYTYPRGMDAASWWGAGITKAEAREAASAVWDLDMTPTEKAAYDKLSVAFKQESKR